MTVQQNTEHTANNNRSRDLLLQKIIFPAIMSALFCSMFLQNATAALQPSSSTADHTTFKELQKPFRSGPEVTRACLTCHTEAAKQVQHTIHWTWQAEGGVQDGLGKRFVLNNY